MNLLFLLFPAVTALRCFSSSKRSSFEVSQGELCVLEINAFNLECISPKIVSLMDAETAFATNFVKNETELTGENDNTTTTTEATTVSNSLSNSFCFVDKQYLKCVCDKDDCNKDWNTTKASLQLGNNPEEKKLADCVVEKCDAGNCAVFGTPSARAINHYEMPLINVASSKKNKKSNIIFFEYAVIWTIASGLLIAWIAVVVVAFTAGGGCRPRRGSKKNSRSAEVPAPIAEIAPESSGNSGVVLDSKTSAKEQDPSANAGSQGAGGSTVSRR